MKIVLDCRWCRKSGIGAFIDGILPYFIQSGNELLLLGLETLPEEIEAKVSDCDKSKLKFLACDVKPFSIKELLRFPKSVSKIINSYDCYFSPYCNVPGGIKIPVYTTIHDIVFLDVKGLAGRAGTFARKIFYKYACIRSKAVFTVSEFSKKRIIKKLHCRKPIHVVHSSVPEFLLKENAVVAEKNDSIIFIGNIKKHKGLQILIPAFEKFCNQLQAEGKAVPKLVIVGSKENFRTNDETITKLVENSASSNVEFTGFISDEELKVKLTKARILVQPSFYEGFGLPPMQALNCGTHAIVSDIEVFKEVYEKYPVTYFKTGDIEDLTAKLYEVWNENLPVPEFEEQYSFKKTAERILKAVQA